MNNLQLGSKGAEVKLLQLALKRAGFYNGSIDGIFGNSTQQAVGKFQEKNNLDVDFVVGKVTWEKLIEYLKGYVVHTIKSGDTLYKIANEHNTTLQAILLANSGVDANNLQIGEKIYVPLGFELVPTNVDYTSQLNSYICEGLTIRYPFIKKSVIGNSVMGSPIINLKIGTGKTQAFYNASHHANEWITTPLLLKFMEQYATAYATGKKIFNTDAIELYNKATLYMVPMVNPDGVDLVNGVVTGKYYDTAVKYANNYPEIPFPDGWKANINGVDLNLQYPANWNKAREIKFAQGFTKPGPRDFVGQAPVSQPESASLYNYTRKMDFAITLSYHSQGEVIYWKYLDYEPENSRKIAEYFGKVSGYLVEETPYASGFAGYKDWFIEKYNRPGYTIEVGVGQSPVPLFQFPKIYSDNLGILVGAITQI